MAEPFDAQVARRLVDIERGLESLRTSQRLAAASLFDTSIPVFGDDGFIKQNIGKQPDGSYTDVVLDGPTPLQPTDPLCAPGAFVIEVSWNGNLIGPFGEVDAELENYADFLTCEVHLGTSETFIPDSTTLVGQIGREGGAATVASPAGTVYVRLRIRSQANKVGPPSPAVAVEVDELVDPTLFEALDQALAENEAAVANLRDVTLPALEADLNAASAWISTSGADLSTRLVAAEGGLSAAESAIEALDDEVAIAATTAAIENLYVTGTGTMDEGVINRLWADVVRSRQITTDMLVVGSGENLLLDPYFESDTVKAARDLSADVMGGWGRDSATLNLNWYGGGGQPTTRTLNFYFTAGHPRTKEVAIPVEEGETYRFKGLANSVGAGCRWTAVVFKTDGTSTYVGMGPYTGAGNSVTPGATYTIPAGVTHIIPGIQWANAVTSAHIYGGATMTRMTDASLIVDGTIKAVKLDTTEVAAALATVIELNAGRITSGVIDTARLNAQEIAAVAGEFLEITANQITGGNINAAIGFTTAGKLVVGATSGRHVEIGNGAVTAYKPGQAGRVATAQMGGAADSFTIVDAAGEELAGIHSDGSMATTEADIGVLRVAGQPIEELLDPMPRGVQVWSGLQADQVGPYSEETGVWEFSLDAFANRRYEITITGEFMSLGHETFLSSLRKTQTTLGGTPPAPRVSSPLFVPSFMRIPTPTGAWDSRRITWWFQPNADESARFLWTIVPYPGVSAASVRARQFSVVVNDLGLHPENAGRPSLGGASGTTPDPKPPTQDYVKEWALTPHQVWTQYGRGDTYAPQWVRAGTQSGVNSIYRTYLALPQAALDALASATAVSKIELRLSQVDGWNGNPWIGTSTAKGSAISGSTEPARGNMAQLGTIKYGETRWLRLNSTQIAALKGSANSIAVGNRSSSEILQSFAGPSAASSKRPLIRITYTA